MIVGASASHSPGVGRVLQVPGVNTSKTVSATTFLPLQGGMGSTTVHNMSIVDNCGPLIPTTTIHTMGQNPVIPPSLVTEPCTSLTHYPSILLLNPNEAQSLQPTHNLLALFVTRSTNLAHILPSPQILTQSSLLTPTPVAQTRAHLIPLSLSTMI